MKPRHAAALALVGWYLMVPPLTRVKGRSMPDFGAPLSKWGILDSYDYALSCNNDRREEWQQAKEQDDGTEKAHDKRLLYTAAACISTDDPRLKEK